MALPDFGDMPAATAAAWAAYELRGDVFLDVMSTWAETDEETEETTDGS